MMFAVRLRVPRSWQERTSCVLFMCILAEHVSRATL